MPVYPALQKRRDLGDSHGSSVAKPNGRQMTPLEKPLVDLRRDCMPFNEILVL